MHVATKFQFVKDMIPAKCNKAEQNKTRYACMIKYLGKKERYILKINQSKTYIENKVGNVGNGAGTGGARILMVM